MSWFKRKNNPPVEHIEPTIRLIERDADELKDVSPETAPGVDDAHELPGADAATEHDAQSAAASALHVRVRKSHDIVDVEAHPVPEAQPDAVAVNAKAPGRFAGLAARFKRAPAAAQSQTDSSTPASVAPEAATAPAAPATLEVDKAEQAAPSEQATPAEAADAAEPSAPVDDVDGTPKTKAKGFKGLRARMPAGRSEKPKFSAVPVRVVIGFLPEVTERDALEYAVGIAEKHFEQIGMSYFDAFKFGSGYAFEAHEGGTGKAYLPEVIRYFESKGPFRPGEQVSAVIRTATRAVEVQRTRDGLVAIILPERDETPPSDWLEPTTSMQPAINKRTGFLVAGAALFTTGFIAMMVTSMLTRFQEYDPAPEPVMHRIEASQLPNQQWSMIASIPANNFVRALRYRNGRWESPEIVAATVATSTAPTSTVPPGAAPHAAAPVTPPPPTLAPAGAPAPAPAPSVSTPTATQGAAR
jgi:hypothetical protein